jgi:uncharacterized repeat protein (TIGR03803 family)
MKDPAPSRSGTFGRFRHLVRTTLSLAIMLPPAVLASRSAHAQTFSVLYSFTGGTDGGNSMGNLMLDKLGNLYGTTDRGGYLPCNGNNSGCGTVFKLDITGKETTLHSFTWTGGDGAYPEAGIVQDMEGNLYGTTVEGGRYGCGIIFRVDKTGKETVLHTFSGKGHDGCQPYASLIRDAAGNLYGTTWGGGSNGGTVFKLDEAGKERVLHAFTGAVIPAGLVRDERGNLYGVTLDGGAYHDGTVFKVCTIGKATVLHSFSGTSTHGPDGVRPEAGLVRGPEGNLYGTTVSGGIFGYGTVFKVDKNGRETVLHSFSGTGDGAQPFADLVMDSRGNLYGTTFYGGVFNHGTVFKVDKAGKETVLYNFVGNGDGVCPWAGLARDAKGNLYGTTSFDYIHSDGSAAGYGTVFKLTPDVGEDWE